MAIPILNYKGNISLKGLNLAFKNYLIHVK